MPKSVSGRLAPPEIVIPGLDSARDERAREEGLALLRAGRVGCLLVAGGQGTRLGVALPKGMIEVCGKSLFERFANSIASLRRRVRRPIPLYVMTSFATHEETVAYFQSQKFFGLPSNDVVFFQQGTVPTRDRRGKPLRGLGGGPLLNPDGHGGMLEAARKNGVLADARKRGLTTLFYFQVDNPLVAICSPLFLGFHAMRRSQYSLKIVRKRDAEEKMGVVCRKGRRLCLVEYSELPESLRYAEDGHGKLKFDAGSIAVHIFDVAFLAKEASRKRGLPWHRAHKLVRALDAKGGLVEMEAVKSERFIFDLLPRATRALVVETSREEEFSPIKNATGSDSLESAERALRRRDGVLI